MGKLISFILIFFLFGIIQKNQLQSQSVDNTNVVKNEFAIKELKKCLQNKIKYPFFMQLHKLEGRVYVVLKINKKGKVEDMHVEADYFGKIYEIEKFTNKKRIERLRNKTSKRLIPLFAECTQNIIFNYYENDNIIRIPVSFGTYDDFDDYGISDDYDDYAYMEDYDYNYYDYD